MAARERASFPYVHIKETFNISSSATSGQNLNDLAETVIRSPSTKIVKRI